MTIICTEEQKKAVINARFCPFGDCPFYSKEHGAKYETCKQCREENIEWKEERPQGEWIPVSKELPNKNGWYICTCEGICNRTVGVVGYDAIRKKWGRGGVIAWQSLPEPYKQD